MRKTFPKKPPAEVVTLKSSPLARLAPVLILNVIEIGIALPVLPALALGLGGDAVDVGLLYALQSFGQFVMAPMWGSLSDHHGRKPVLLATFVLAGIAECLTALAPSLLLLYIARLLVGFCAGNVATASALIADVTSEENRSKGMALVGMSFGIGFTIGPAIGALISIFAHEDPGIWGTGLPFLAAGILSFFTAVIGVFLLVEPEKTAEERERARRRVTIRDITRTLKDHSVATMCGLFFLYSLSVSVMEGTAFLYFDAVHDYGEEEVGFIFAGLGLFMAFLQGGIGRVSKKIGDRHMTIVGGSLLALGFIAAPFFTYLPLFLGFLGLSTVGRALIHPGMLAITSRSAPSDVDTGRVMGVLQSSGSLGRIVGPAAGGWVFAQWVPGAPFWMAGAVMGIAILWWLFRSQNLRGNVPTISGAD